MSLCVKPVRVLKVGVLKAQLGCLVVHHLRKPINAAAAVAGERRCGVVSGNEQQPVEKLAHCIGLAALEVH